MAEEVQREWIEQIENSIQELQELQELITEIKALKTLTTEALTQALRHEAELLQLKTEFRQLMTAKRQLLEDFQATMAWTVSEYSHRVFEKEFRKVVEEAVERNQRVSKLSGGGFKPKRLQ